MAKALWVPQHPTHRCVWGGCSGPWKTEGGGGFRALAQVGAGAPSIGVMDSHTLFRQVVAGAPPVMKFEAVNGAQTQTYVCPNLNQNKCPRRKQLHSLVYRKPHVVHLTP